MLMQVVHESEYGTVPIGCLVAGGVVDAVQIHDFNATHTMMYAEQSLKDTLDEHNLGLSLYEENRLRLRVQIILIHDILEVASRGSSRTAHSSGMCPWIVSDSKLWMCDRTRPKVSSGGPKSVP